MKMIEVICLMKQRIETLRQLPPAARLSLHFIFVSRQTRDLADTDLEVGRGAGGVITPVRM